VSKPPRQRGLAAVTAAGTDTIALAQAGNLQAPKAPLDVFAHDPRNHRVGKHDPDLEDFAARMRKLGQLQPIVVATAALYRDRYQAEAAKVPYGADYVVIMGNRRLRAAPLAELTELSYTVNDGLLDHDDYREAALDENLRRLDITCLDLARLLRDFLQIDGTQQKVADRIGKSRPYVAQRLALLELVPEAQDAIDARLIGFDQARTLSPLSPDAQRAAVVKMISVTPVTDDKELIPVTGVTPRPEAKPPTRKAAGTMLSRYKRAYGADAVAALLRDELDGSEVTAFVTVAAQNLRPEELDALLHSLSMMRDSAASPGSTTGDSPA
jgi:ParB/RepB/Spo0J family partition protein